MASPGTPSLGYNDAYLWIQGGQWQGVSSSNVMEIKYNTRLSILSVRFRATYKGIPTPVYHYQGVPSDIATQMFVATSKGVFLHERVKGIFTAIGPVRE